MKVVDRKKRRERLKNKIKNQASGPVKGLSQIKNAVTPGGSRSGNNSSTYVRMPNNSRGYDRFRASRRFPDDIEYEEAGSKPKKKAAGKSSGGKKNGSKSGTKTQAKKKQGQKSGAKKAAKKTQPAPPPSSSRKRTPEIEQRYQELLGPSQTTVKNRPFPGASVQERRDHLNGVPIKKAGKKKKKQGKRSNTTFSTGRKRRSGRIAQMRKRHKVRAKRIYRILLLLIGIAVIFGAVMVYRNRNVLISRFIHNTKKQQEVQLTKSEVMEKAELLADGYDYDGAIEELKTIKNYDQDSQITDTIKEWETVKQNLVEFKAEDVTHIFYHTLVRDTKLAFECDPAIADDFKEWMTTIDEFDKITQTMYDEGYVLCSLYDFFDEEYDEDGTPHFTEKSVYLPEGKKPFILSIDDLSYYHTYTGHGMATKLVLDDNGKITCEYENTDGSVETGSFDCVPRMNDFLEKHPDGAYHGARGTIALTGYNGVFGYRTDESYVTQENLDADKKQWLEDHPDYDYDEEVANAKKIADELKAEGWDFASHTWGHLRIGNISLEKLKIDTEKWLENVEPIIGDTECIIFAHGQDLSDSDEYDTDNNEKYQYLADKGFHIFLNVDSYQKTMSVHDLYVHGGRRDLDGYRLWSDAYEGTDWTSDLFNAKDIVDSRRTDVPTPTE